MAARDNFLAKAQQLAAALIYAPRSASAGLSNLGQILLPDGALKEGAVLQTPGLLRGAAQAALDGTNDYIDSLWATRTNLITNPSFEVDTADWISDSTNATVETFARSLSPFLNKWGDGVWALNTKAKATAGGAFFRVWSKASGGSAGYPVAAGQKVAVSAQIRVNTLPAKGPGIYVRWLNAANATISDSFSATSMATKVGVQAISAVLTAPANAASFHIMIGHYNQGNALENGETTAFEVDSMMAEIADATGSYFPTSAQIEAGEAGWTGTEHNSASMIGPFASGTKRTFVGYHSRAIPESADTLLGSSAAAAGSWVRLHQPAVSRTITLTVNGGFNAVSWANAWPALTGPAFWALTFDEAADTAELFVNGNSQGTKAVAQQFSSEVGRLQLGARGPGNDAFVGSALPFAVFLRTLTAAQIYELYRSGLPARRRRKPPLGLDLEVETPDGFKRVGSGARKASDRPRGLNFSTQRGDGFAGGGASLSRPIFKDHPDVGLLDTWRMTGQNGETAYEGRLHSNPRTTEPEEQIDLNFVGWATYLRSRKINPIIVDRRLSSWGEITKTMMAELLAAGRKMFSAQVLHSDSGVPVLRLSVQEPWPSGSRCAAAFASPDAEIGEIRYSRKKDVGDNYTYRVQLTPGDSYVGAVAKEGLIEAAVTNDSLAASGAASPAHYAVVSLGNDIESLSGNETSDSFFDIRVIGTHGLTARGSQPNEGYWISDVIRWILDTYYPKMNFSGPDNTFPITQGSWHDARAHGYDIIQQLNNLVLWETNVWEDRTLTFEPADLTKYDWQISTDEEGVTAVFEGDSIENFANGVEVTYTGFDGIKRVLYPSEHSALRDDSDENPANRHGEPLWTDVEFPYPCSEDEALQFGRAYLAEYNRPKRPATYNVTGHILDGAGHWQQGWRPRNSETLGVRNHPEDSPRLITATSWDDETKILRITVDAPDKLLDAVVARHEMARQTRNLGS